jgi:hypothetical protein
MKMIIFSTFAAARPCFGEGWRVSRERWARGEKGGSESHSAESAARRSDRLRPRSQQAQRGRPPAQCHAAAAAAAAAAAVLRRGGHKKSLSINNGLSSNERAVCSRALHEHPLCLERAHALREPLSGVLFFSCSISPLFQKRKRSSSLRLIKHQTRSRKVYFGKTENCAPSATAEWQSRGIQDVLFLSRLWLSPWSPSEAAHLSHRS